MRVITCWMIHCMKRRRDEHAFWRGAVGPKAAGLAGGCRGRRRSGSTASRERTSASLWRRPGLGRGVRSTGRPVELVGVGGVFAADDEGGVQRLSEGAAECVLVDLRGVAQRVACGRCRRPPGGVAQILAAVDWPGGPR